MHSPWDWTRADLDQLIGQAESLRLEFKQSRLFEQDRNKIIDVLTKGVSAFANTEGGTIVIGIKEEKEGATRFASAVDSGITIAEWPLERLQQTIEASVRPHLTGLRLRAIPLSDDHTRCAISISVPQGTTAYQARDYIYYGRSEYESKPLPDHEVRLRMFRGRTRQAAVVLDNASSRVRQLSPTEHKGMLVESLGYTEEELDRLADDEVVSCRYHQFGIYVENVGEINLSEFKVTISVNSHGISERFPNPIVMTVKEGWVDYYGFDKKINEVHRVNIYPRDRYKIRQMSFWVRQGQRLDDLVLRLEWTLYLRDTLPYTGSVDVIDHIRNAASEGNQ